MPNTRSQSSLSDIDNTSLAPAEAEVIAKRLSDKEKQIREQIESLNMRQAELEKRESSLNRNQTAMLDLRNLSSTIENFQKEFSVLRAIPDEILNLKQQINKINSENRTQQPAKLQYPNDNFLPSSITTPHHPAQPSPIRLKDAVESIPKYDGHNISIFQFCKMCERVQDLIPFEQEQYLVQLIINKLQGHAYQAVEGSEIHSVADLAHRLKSVFGPNKSLDQYRGELGNAYMKPNENIFDYIGRIKDLRTAIMDGELTLRGHFDEWSIDNIEKSVLDSFVNGLPSDILIRVKLEGYNNLDEAIIKAIQVSKLLEAEALRQKPLPPRGSSATHRADTYTPRYHLQPTTATDTRKILQRPANTPFIKPLIPGLPGPNAPVQKTCRYCKKDGHLIDECRKLAYKRSDRKSVV